jgi:hypothetical protein
MAKLEKLAQWLEREHPDAADSLREGMEECFSHQPAGRAAIAASVPGQHEQLDRREKVA